MKLLERRRNLIGAFARFIRFISGKPPLTLEACVNDKSTVDYKLYGESVQDGTPTPNAPIEVESVGELVTDETDTNYGKYKIPVVASENIVSYPYNNGELHTINGIIYEVYSDGRIHFYGTATANTNYGICVISNNAGEKIRIKGLKGASENSFHYMLNGIAMIYENDFVTDIKLENKLYIRIPVGATVDATILPIVYRKEPITTNIYLDEPLRKIGDYADYIDFENQVVVRNIKRVDLKNANNTYSWVGKNGVTFASVLDKNYNRNNNALCNRNYYWTANGGENHTMWLGVGSRTLFWIGILDYLGFTTKEELNEWLTSNPTYLLYGSDLPIETPIELPQLPTFKGTTIYSVDTNIQPSNMEVTYYSKERSVS